MNDGQFQSLLVLVGELKGQQAAALDQMARMYTEMIRIQTDLDKKHEENRVAIYQQRDAARLEIRAHQEEDEKYHELINARLKRYDRVLYIGLGVLVAIQAIPGIVAIAKIIKPIL